MNRYQVFVRCRELPSAHAEYSYTLDASAFYRAAAEGLKKFRREPHAHKKHLTCIELRVTLLCKAPSRPRHEEHVLPLYDREK